MAFVRNQKTKKPRLWFVFFKSTWKDIFFNEQEGIPEEINTIGVFEESKKRGMTPNLSLMVRGWKSDILIMELLEIVYFIL